jgi:hypothetical protein
MNRDFQLDAIYGGAAIVVGFVVLAVSSGNPSEWIAPAFVAASVTGIVVAIRHRLRRNHSGNSGWRGRRPSTLVLALAALEGFVGATHYALGDTHLASTLMVIAGLTAAAALVSIGGRR